MSDYSIKAVSLDGDGTLWDFEASMRHALELALAELRAHAPGEKARALTVDRAIAIRDRVFAQRRDLAANLEAVRLEAFRQTAAEAGAPGEALARRLNALYHENRFKALELYEDVPRALQALGESFQLGLVSNGNSYPEKLGLGGVFQFTVFAQDCGFAKPDPRIFALALERAGCRREQMAHIGDSLGDDVRGAKNAGILAIWLNRTGAANETGIEPDYEIADLREAVRICEGI
ncbi:MAG: Flavin mononucleotide phosphatase YigB [candidate division BRC1 bacterium ADurb.BinA364]|nr:MAG: Flavin mononucleotide phosphatase YigB [candidate division BRC1 bacterium ADurb.BinA364]